MKNLLVKGGGSLDDVNWLLARNYQVHCKDYSGQQAKRLASSVVDWYVDPHLPERQFGWVTAATDAYVRPVKRIAVRCRQQDGQWAVGVLISTLSAQHVLLLTGQAPLVAGGSGSRVAGVRQLLRSTRRRRRNLLQR